MDGWLKPVWMPEPQECGLACVKVQGAPAPPLCGQWIRCRPARTLPPPRRPGCSPSPWPPAHSKTRCTQLISTPAWGATHPIRGRPAVDPHCTVAHNCSHSGSRTGALGTGSNEIRTSHSAEGCSDTAAGSTRLARGCRGRATPGMRWKCSSGPQKQPAPKVAFFSESPCAAVLAVEGSEACLWRIAVLWHGRTANSLLIRWNAPRFRCSTFANLPTAGRPQPPKQCRTVEKCARKTEG